jgi:hypothetical protein
MVRYPKGITRDILVKVREAYVLTDSVLLNMGDDKETLVILGRPFLNTMNACIYVGSRQIQPLHFEGN